MKSIKNSLTTFTRTLKGAIMQGCVGFIVDISSRNDEYPIEVTLTKNSQFKTLSFKIDEIELIEE